LALISVELERAGACSRRTAQRGRYDAATVRAKKVISAVAAAVSSRTTAE
jgi:hypothetical protein